MFDAGEGQALIGAVIGEPREDLHRLAYADWLDDQEPDSPRARFIRAQVAGDDHLVFDLLCEYNARVAGLPAAALPRCSPGWVDFGLAGGAAVVRVERGFARGVTCERLDWWLTHGPGCAARHPVEYLEVADRAPRDDRRYKHPYGWWEEAPGTARLLPWLVLPGTITLPPDVFTRLRGAKDKTGHRRGYTTLAEALADLSRAGIAAARDRQLPAANRG